MPICKACDYEYLQPSNQHINKTLKYKQIPIINYKNFHFWKQCPTDIQNLVISYIVDYRQIMNQVIHNIPLTAFYKLLDSFSYIFDIDHECYRLPNPVFWEDTIQEYIGYVSSKKNNHFHYIDFATTDTHWNTLIHPKLESISAAMYPMFFHGDMEYGAVDTLENLGSYEEYQDFDFSEIMYQIRPDTYPEIEIWVTVCIRSDYILNYTSQ